MAKVYLALMGGLAGFSKLLVVKVLRRDLLGGADDGVRMFIEEARLAARLVHPNIVHTYEVGEIHGHYFMAMEYLDGQPYSEILTRARGDKELPVAEHLRIVAEVARGLHYAHSLTGYQGEPQGIVHRDVSPQNIFVTYQGQVKLLDFGIAKPQDPSHLTQVGVIKGRLDYIAPEQLQCEPLDARADVFALGAILWEALSGQRFAGGKKVSEIGKVQARIAAGERKLREVAPDLPDELIAIVERAIALQPADRWPDAMTFADALDGYVESMGERPSAKSLSRLVGGMFTTERDSIAKLIDEQVQWTKRYTIEIGDTTGDLPRLAIPNSNITGSYPATSTTTFTGVPLEYNGAAMSAELGLDSKKKRLRMWLGGGVMVVAVLIGGTLAWRERPTGAASSAAVASAPTPEADVVSAAQRAKGAPENPASVSIRLTTQPPEARISLDGVVLLAPFSGEFRKDRALHHLEVTADGYKPVRSFLSFEEDQNLTIRLEPLASATRESVREGAVEAASERSATATSIAASERARASRAATASVPSRAIVPGAEIEERDPRLDSDELDLDNPYLKRK